MGFLIDNFIAKKNVSVNPKPNGIADRLSSINDASVDVSEDEVASILLKVLGLYRTTIFPNVAEGIKEVASKTERTLANELDYDKQIKVLNVSSDIIYAVQNSEPFSAITTRPNYPILLGDLSTLDADDMKRFLDTVTEKNLNDAWDVLGSIMSGNERVASLTYGSKFSHLTEIVYALAMSLKTETAPTNTRATIGNYRILVSWIKNVMKSVMTKYISIHTNMVAKDVLIHNVVANDIYIISDTAKRVASTLNQAGNEYTLKELIFGAVISNELKVTANTLIEKSALYNNVWVNYIKSISIASRASSIKYLKRAYDDLFNSKVGGSTKSEFVSVKREKFRTLINGLSQEELSDIESTVEKIYGNIFYPESGYARFMTYVKAYKKMNRGFSFDDMVAMALTEMAADLILDSCEIYENTKTSTRA